MSRFLHQKTQNSRVNITPGISNIDEDSWPTTCPERLNHDRYVQPQLLIILPQTRGCTHPVTNRLSIAWCNRSTFSWSWVQLSSQGTVRNNVCSVSRTSESHCWGSTVTSPPKLPSLLSWPLYPFLGHGDGAWAWPTYTWANSPAHPCEHFGD